MKIYANEKLIKRNHKLGNILSIGALLILGAGMYLSYKVTTDNLKIILSYSFLIGGFLIFQVGNYFMNRWGKSPRPDEILSAQLKGLDDKYSLYHYTTPVSHLLVGPAGVIALIPFGQNGTLKYEEKKNTWKQYGGNFFLKLFGQEGLGRPISEAKYIKEDLDRYLTKIGATPSAVNSSTLLVFTNEKADVNGEGSPVQYVTAAKLKDHIRKRAKEVMANTDSINTLIGLKDK
jgi:hypothetical protein